MHDRGMLPDTVPPAMGEVVLPTSPLRFHGSREPGTRLEPDVGGDTDAVLAQWLGLEGEAIATLRSVGAIA